MTNRIGDWMQTATGKQYWPLDPRADEVDIVDIAYALSKICRYGGHCRRFYSVAEHSVYVAQACPPILRMRGLLHDAAEAYLGDKIRPLKRYLANFHEIEALNEAAIAEHFGLPALSAPEVKAIDNNIILDEHAQVMAKGPAWDNPAWEMGREPLGVEIQCWRPERAAEKFLEEFIVLGGELS